MDKDKRESVLRKLRINIKSLAAEARFNRMEKKKASQGWIKMELDRHRTGPLRFEARVSQLAYAFVRGVPYQVVENKVKDADVYGYLQARVEKKLQRMGFYCDQNNLKEWCLERRQPCAA